MEKFRHAVEAVLNNWSALQLAVEHGMGGPFGKQTALLMVDEIVSIFLSHAKIEQENVADILADILDAKFNTICEDDSPYEVAAVLWNIFQHCASNNDDLLQNELNKLTSSPQWLSSQPMANQSTQLSTVAENGINCYGIADENSVSLPPTPMEGISSNMEEGGEGQMASSNSEWTQVGPRRKK